MFGTGYILKKLPKKEINEHISARYNQQTFEFHALLNVFFIIIKSAKHLAQDIY